MKHFTALLTYDGWNVVGAHREWVTVEATSRFDAGFRFRSYGHRRGKLVSVTQLREGV